MTKITPTLLALIFIFSVGACSTPDLPPSVPVVIAPPTSSPPAETPTATATEIPVTLTPEKVVIENVPADLKIIVEGNITYAINRLGEKIEIARDGKTAEWLNYSLAATQADTINNPELYMVPYEGGAKITNKKTGRLNAQPFPEGTVPGEAGDVTLEKVLNFIQLGWGSTKAIPAKIVGYFTTEYEGKILYGKIVEWLTKDEGIVYLSLIDSKEAIEQYPSEAIFPAGIKTGEVPKDAFQPISNIMRNKAINNQLQIWGDTGSPTAALEDFFLVGGSK